MSVKTIYILLIFFSAIIFQSKVNAATSNYGLFPRTRVSAFQTLYSGEQAKSFAETSIGYGIGIQSANEARYLAPFIGLKAATLTGRQAFLDDTTEVTTPFNFYAANLELGAQLFPLERRTKGVNIYLSASLLVSYNFISLSRSAVLTTIPYNDQSFSNGYAAGMGAEWILSTATINKWSLTTEVLYKQEKATLFKREFDLSSFVLSLGLGW